MNREQMDKQLKLYDQGLTSSKEEMELVNQLGSKKAGSQPWFSYLHRFKKSVPGNLEKDIWASIQSLEKRKYRKLYQIVSVAASLIVAFGLFSILFSEKPESMSLEEKTMLYEEALILANSEPAIGEILYEDESLIIYTK